MNPQLNELKMAEKLIREGDLVSLRKNFELVEWIHHGSNLMAMAVKYSRHDFVNFFVKKGIDI